MTFPAFETSIESGQPIELFVFQFGPDIYNLTSYNRDINFGGIDYTSIQIATGDVEASNEDVVNRLSIEMPLDHPIPQSFIANVPGVRGSIQFYRGHANDGAAERVLLFDGFVTNVENDGRLTAKLSCKPQTAVFNRQGPRMTYQGLCNHVLYDARCKILRSAFTYTGLASAVVGSTVTVNGLAANGPDWAVGGTLLVPTAAPLDRRLITAQSGDDITVLLPPSVAVLGVTVDILAGCDHSLATCDSKFSNVINYGGFPFVPTKNPFNSDIRGGT